MRSGFTHTLATPYADAYQRITSGGADTPLVLAPNCNAVILSAETATVFVTFDDTVGSATNGLPIISGAQPVYIPLGKTAHESGGLHIFSATGILHVIQLS
jgi:hypothetical protein